MEDEELNEEVMGDPDDVREVTDDLQHDESDAGVQSSTEEPEGEPCPEDYHLQEQIDVMQKQIEGLMSSISTIIESGATVVEPAAPTPDSESDKEEPLVYLEDLDYTM